MPLKSSSPIKKVAHVTVGAFFEIYGAKLKMRLESSSEGIDKVIREPTVNRPGLALTGFYSYFAHRRMQIFGSAELSYLSSLAPPERHEKLQRFFHAKIPCLVVARNLKISREILDLAEQYEVPVFSTSMITMKFINAATLAMETEFAPTTIEHGSMVEIQGIGTLIRGTSGMGKSECVLSLIERGYCLVSDDVVRVRVLDNELIASSPELTRFLIEVRGIGLINVKSVFGAGSVRNEKHIEFVVTLKEWDEVENIERIGLEEDTYEILGVRIPHVTIPVRIGRDLGRLVEVAALDQKLKTLGEKTAFEFNQKLLKKINPHHNH